MVSLNPAITLSQLVVGRTCEGDILHCRRNFADIVKSRIFKWETILDKSVDSEGHHKGHIGESKSEKEM